MKSAAKTKTVDKMTKEELLAEVKRREEKKKTMKILFDKKLHRLKLNLS